MAAAMIPSMMLVLGSVLHKGPGSAKVPIKIILGVLGVRQILIPFLGMSYAALNLLPLLMQTAYHFAEGLGCCLALRAVVY